MKVGILQLDISKKIEENIEKILEIISTKKANIFLLPELSDRGYLYNSREELLSLSVEIDENLLIKRLKEESFQNNKVVIVGIAEKCRDKVFNSVVIIDSGKILGVYRKLHLTDFEKKYFDSGEENRVFQVKGLNIGIQICFDLWFPEVSREQLRAGAQLFLVLGNFGGVTTYEICKIRAIENLTPFILCNRVGIEKNKELSAYFFGNSVVYSGDGKILITPKKEEECYLEIELDELRRNSNIMCSDFLREIEKHKN